MKKIFIVLSCLFVALPLLAQNGQVIKGQITDKDAKYPLIAVFVFLYQDTVIVSGEPTDLDGYFEFSDIEPGRYRVEARNIGYRDVVVPVTLVQGKESFVDIEMEESITELSVLEINAYDKAGTVNEMATVSARMFDTEEAQRYAGSRSDPARMAANYAGVQGADDSRNDIVIRGNGPGSVLWRLEGIDIPNPNHFSVPGTAGGPVTMLNHKTLANSDFYTGAFPAEYGNTTSGVFDLKFRNGNPDKYEGTGQFGFLGTEFLVEGPINREKRSSFLATYRYSTLGIFDALGINTGTDAIPRYQDFMMKLKFPTKGGGQFTVFGLGGTSDIDIKISEVKDTSELDIYSDQDRDQFFNSSAGVIGVGFTKTINEHLYLKTTVAGSKKIVDVYHTGIERIIDDNGEYQVTNEYDMLQYYFGHDKLSNSTIFNFKRDKRNLVKTGWVVDYNFYDYFDSLDTKGTGDWYRRIDYKGSALLAQPFVQWKHRFSNALVTNLGWHMQYYSLNNSFSAVEPRFGAKYEFLKNNWLSFGVGLHSQLQSQFSYFSMYDEENKQNFDMGFTKSAHFVFGYDRQIARNLRMKSEVYYQHLYNVPVEINSNHVSLINQGGSFSRYFADTVSNTGLGKNYGVEVSVEKFFSNNWFMLVSATVYESKFTGHDGKWRDSDWNGNYAVNAVGGYEKKIGKGVLGASCKFTMAGGKRYGVIDSLRSVTEQEVIYTDSMYNEFTFKDYFRYDLKVNYTLNSKKVSHEFAVDLVNVFNVQNLLRWSYIPIPGSDRSPFRPNYQLGFLPVFYYKIDF